MTPQEMKELQDRLNARLKRDGKERYFWEVCFEESLGEEVAILRNGVRACVPHILGVRACVPHILAAEIPEDKEERLYTECLFCLEKHLEHQEEQNR